MSQPIRGLGSHLIFGLAWKTRTWLRTLRSCYSSNFLEFCLVVSEEMLKMCQPIRDKGVHLVFMIGKKYHKLGGGRWDLLSCQVSLYSIQQFQKRSQKCDHNSALQPSAQVHENVKDEKILARGTHMCSLEATSFFVWKGLIKHICAILSSSLPSIRFTAKSKGAIK